MSLPTITNGFRSYTNSFVTFFQRNAEERFITQDNCGIQEPFCLPIAGKSDLIFNIQASAEYSDTSRWFVDVGNETLSGVTIVATQYEDSNNFNIRFSFSGSSLLDSLTIDDCFDIVIKFNTVEDDEFEPIFVTFRSQQCFKYVLPCFTSTIEYWNNESAFGFYYTGLSSLSNKVRLPLYFKNPDFQSTKTTYERSNGTTKLLSARINKNYTATVDHITEEVHQKLVVALNHDNTQFITENNYILNCVFQDEYNQEFPLPLQGMNTWPATFSVRETPFANYNTNCQ
jgi:hypothetical protein